MRYNQFERLQRWAALQKPPEIKFKDLEAVVDSSIEYNTLPVQVEVQYTRITNENILAGIEQGWVRPHVDRAFAFEQAGEAHAYIEARKNIGKIVLVTGD